MLETLFGAEMPLVVRFFLAFLIVLGLIGAAAWAVRRFGSSRYGGTGQRGRQPRLAIIDHASVDARRRLILIRRDNVEHLLLIGGPTDVVVEPNIVRAMPASREVPATRAPAVAELLPHAIPLPDTGSNDSWPLQPEPVISPVKQHTEAPPRAQRDALTALADSLAVHPVTPSRTRPAAAARTPVAEPRVEPRSEPRPEPRIPAQPANAEIPSAVDQSIADMAHRLEAALRKPKTADGREAAAPAVAPRAASSPEPSPQAETPASPPAAPRPARAAEAQPARPDVPAKEGKALYDSLEQEMASLLGRPAAKT